MPSALHWAALTGNLRVAVIGAGAMGINHARVYSDMDSVELVAVVDVDPVATGRVCQRFRATPFGDAATALQATRPDIVSVTVPTSLHEPVALEAIDFGCHVLVEKPLALSLEAGRRIISAADSRGVKLTVGHTERFNPVIVAIKDRLERNELGRLFQIHARRVSPFPGRVQDVGVILDLATHDIDVIRHLLGAEVERVFAETERKAHASCEDLFSALLRFSNGVVGVLDVNWLTPTKVRQLTILGEGGMYLADYLTQDLYWYKNSSAPGGTWDALTTFRGAWEGDMVKVRIDKREPLRAELESFVSAVLENRDPAVSGDDGLAAIDISLTLMEAGQRHVPLAPRLTREPS